MNKLLLLRRVARSFYLSIRLLPSPLQEPISLAYLLARASDTMVDEEESTRTPSEQELVRLLPLLIEELNNPLQDPFNANAIKAVWQTILEGQQWDEERKLLPKSYPSLSSAELNLYLYQVAGSVGEFWTKLAAYHLTSFSRESLEVMMGLGSDYGKGLQLINILRDRYHDAEQRRYYCREDQITQLQDQAWAYLKQGKHYVKALSPGRFKMASALPLLLAEKTLKLVQKYPQATKVKISRYEVYLTLLRALPLLFC